MRPAEALYDRLYGKSKQRHEVEASSGPILPEVLDTRLGEEIAERHKVLKAESEAPEEDR